MFQFSMILFLFLKDFLNKSFFGIPSYLFLVVGILFFPFLIFLDWKIIYKAQQEQIALKNPFLVEMDNKINKILERLEK